MTTNQNSLSSFRLQMGVSIMIFLIILQLIDTFWKPVIIPTGFATELAINNGAGDGDNGADFNIVVKNVGVINWNNQSIDFLDEIEKEISWHPHRDVENGKVRVFGTAAVSAHYGFAYLAKHATKEMGMKLYVNKGGRDGSYSTYVCAGSATTCFRGNLAPKHLEPYHRVNKIPLLASILTNKAGFCATVKRNAIEPAYMESSFECWIIPLEKQEMLEYDKAHPNDQFIVKPTNLGKGAGIKVVDSTVEIAKRKSKIVVQTLMQNPFLLNGFKFDIRTYVVLLQASPARVVVHERGLVRVAGLEYKPSSSEKLSKGQFLTNTHISNQFSKSKVEDRTLSFEQLKLTLDEIEEGTYDRFWTGLLKSTASVMLCAEREFKKKYFATKTPHRPHFYQLVGVDFIADADLNIKMIEINTTPSLSLGGNKKSHYAITKISVVSDLFSMILTKKEVAPILKEILSFSHDKPWFSHLTISDWAYAIRFMKETSSRKGYHFAYPNLDYDEFHAHYLDIAKATPSRQALHQLLMYILRRL